MVPIVLDQTDLLLVKLDRIDSGLRGLDQMGLPLLDEEPLDVDPTGSEKMDLGSRLSGQWIAGRRISDYYGFEIWELPAWDPMMRERTN